MASRLDRIMDWKRVARRTGYHVDRLARTTGVTERQLERYFGACEMQTPKAWLDELRMADARRYLRRGWMIKQVVERLGFKHVQDFTRAFERVHGITPSEYRHRGAVTGISGTAHLFRAGSRARPFGRT